MGYMHTMNYFKVIRDIRNASQQEADGELDKLCETLIYTAPEARDTVFWYGKGSTMGITEICRMHFSDNIDVYNVYIKAIEDHKGVLKES